MTAKHVLITGSSSGFGFSTAKALAARGHHVSATMRGINAKNAEAASELRNWAKAEGHKLEVVEMDVCDQASVDQAIAAANASAPIDVVINNAGIANFGIDEGFSIDQAQRIFDTNVFGPMRVSRAVLPTMRKRGSGHMLFVSSGLGRFVLPYLAIYNSSKFALEGYVETIGLELAPEGITCQIIQPGAFGTGIMHKNMQPAGDEVIASYGPSAEIFKAFSEGFMAAVEAGQLGDPQMVVDALVEEVERPSGHEFRRPVGHDVFEPLTAINKSAAEQQAIINGTFGLNG